jgi:hypothetical protein
MRAKHPQGYSLKVLAEEFLLPGRWEVASAPDEVTAADEKTARPVLITLRPAGVTVP